MPSEPESQAEARRDSPDRVNAFTDGVFAIIITILVLEVAVPSNLADDSLLDALEELRPTLVAWVISFVITGMYWVSHRDLFGQLRRVNRDVVWLNLLFLLPVALIPFASSVVGEYPDEPVALQAYGFVLILASLTRLLLYWYVSRRPKLLWDPPDRSGRRVGLLAASAPIAVYVIAMVFAPAWLAASLLLYFAVPLLYILFITLLRQRPETRDDAADYT